MAAFSIFLERSILQDFQFPTEISTAYYRAHDPKISGAKLKASPKGTSSRFTPLG